MTRPCVFFDFDGTVADSFTESLLAYNRVAPRLHLRTIAESELPALRRMGAGELMQALGVPMWKLPRLMIAVRADLHDHFHAIHPVPGVPEALQVLRDSGCHLAMVTSNSEENVRSFLIRHHIDCFEDVVAGASIFGKAHRLRRLTRNATIAPSAVAYVGDTTPDIRAARDAGTLAVAVAWGFSDPGPLAAEAPDALVESAYDLAPAILRLVGVVEPPAT
jgi:phosphoglycolate phosphatase